MITPLKLWVFLLSTWGVLLTGAVSKWTGSPGWLQSAQLQALYREKRLVVEELRSEVSRIHFEAAQLGQSRSAQQREIRKTLGFTAKDEIIFDFSSQEVTQ